MLGSWLPDGFLPTNALHDVAGQHVADGALPMAMACLIKEPIERNVYCFIQKVPWVVFLKLRML